MAVTFKMFPILANLSKSKLAEQDVEWFEGITPQHLIDLEGFSAQDQEAIAVVVNDAQARRDTALLDGDEVELLVNIAGGSSRGGVSWTSSAQPNTLAAHVTPGYCPKPLTPSSRRSYDAFRTDDSFRDRPAAADPTGS